jgi:hypothetical protein
VKPRRHQNSRCAFPCSSAPVQRWCCMHVRRLLAPESAAPTHACNQMTRCHYQNRIWKGAVGVRRQHALRLTLSLSLTGADWCSEISRWERDGDGILFLFSSVSLTARISSDRMWELLAPGSFDYCDVDSSSRAAGTQTSNLTPQVNGTQSRRVSFDVSPLRTKRNVSFGVKQLR